MEPDFKADLAAALKLTEDARTGRERIMVAIAGPPGSGKSTLAAALVAELNKSDRSKPIAVLAPMDGFHLDNRILQARGLRERKGAPETFDAAGFIAALRRLRSGDEDVVLPIFDRERDLAIAGAELAPRQAAVIVVEGNYLLLDDARWRDAHALFDLKLFLAPPIDVLERRLLDRWRGFDLSADEAQARVERNDLPNAKQILSDSVAPDFVLGRSA